MLVGDEGEAELVRKPGDRLVIVADDDGDVNEGLGHDFTLICYCKCKRTVINVPLVARRVEYSREALKALQRIDRATGERIVLKLEQLASRPDSLANNVRALKGPGGFRRLRVGDWRVIFTETLVVVAVERIAPRGSAYD